MNPFIRQNIENWASDYTGSDRIRKFSQPTREYASSILTEFLVAACSVREIEPDSLEEADVKEALLTRVARLSLPPVVREEAVALCADFLVGLEEEGRVADGRTMGAYLCALAPSFNETASGKSKPITNPGSKLGRNDPCPCGSGQKYKKCCMKGN